MCNDYCAYDGYYPGYYRFGFSDYCDPCYNRCDRDRYRYRNGYNSCYRDRDRFRNDYGCGRRGYGYDDCIRGFRDSDPVHKHKESHEDERNRHNHRSNFVKFREFEQHFENDSDFDSFNRDRELDRHSDRYFDCD